LVHAHIVPVITELQGIIPYDSDYKIHDWPSVHVAAVATAPVDMAMGHILLAGPVPIIISFLVVLVFPPPLLVAPPQVLPLLFRSFLCCSGPSSVVNVNFAKSFRGLIETVEAASVVSYKPRKWLPRSHRDRRIGFRGLIDTAESFMTLWKPSREKILTLSFF
jgi:hypothetical protein